MTVSRLQIPTPPRFNFWRTVYSHGWCSLPPFSIDKNTQSLSLIVELSSGLLVRCTLRHSKEVLRCDLQSVRSLSGVEKREIRKVIGDCLRLDDDLADFYKEAKRHPEYRWISRIGAGRMMRAATVFEDVVKMICTTNCSWSLTESMVRNLTTVLGKPFGDGSFSFPQPEAIAKVTEEFMRTNIRAGYRSPYLLELATGVAEGKLDLEAWRTSPLETEELFKQVKSIKGMGDYAAGNILKLLGRYDYLGLDSWVRGKYSELHARGRNVSDKVIHRHYESLGRWRGLFFWLEMTRDWYEHKFPF